MQYLEKNETWELAPLARYTAEYRPIQGAPDRVPSVVQD